MKIKINKEKGYWIGNNVGKEHAHDPELAMGLVSFFSDENAKSIVDMGCGLGDYVNVLKLNDFDCDGFDGNPNTPELTNNMCQIIDLSVPVTFEKKYDWVLSLEVGEHLPEKYEDIFLNNLHNNNKFGIVLSWALKGQGGAGHFNEQNNDHIKNKMANMGYINDIDAENKLRNVASLWWFKNTIMVFRRS